MKKRGSRGEVRPVVDDVFPLEHAAHAITRLESGAVSGKVVIEF